MSEDDKNSGLRGRIDRFFDRRAEEQQELISKALGGEVVENTSKKVTSKESSKLATPKESKKIHKVKKSKGTSKTSETLTNEVEISPIARSFVHLTTDY
ncbi:MAG: hypothetical protein P8R34_04140, partial [archaeon]|nr:hypothetical protein [archaeon]